ncbi:Mbeg1-like protein [Gordonibacter sp.]|uniref:Mbeg1-like protein n=1 Tax=Gordonibacter sp. TaxID=1968902 RepID=UPI002FC7E47C
MNQLDYLASEFASFEEKPFNPVDSIALSQFCMVRGEGIAPALDTRNDFLDADTRIDNPLSPQGEPAHFTDALRAELYDTMFEGFIPDQVKQNMIALAASPRFRDMAVRDYLSLFDIERQTQFAAMTFVYKDQFAYVGFRGTDTSFTGWREDFNMAYASPVPAQAQAVQYLQAVAPHLPQRIYVGGHSKGGNLAVYAALRASLDVQQRIELVYSHDGPGFKKETFAETDWAQLEGRIHRTVPQESVVGMFMDMQAPLLVVKSTGSGIMQHSPFTWEVKGGDFVYLDKLVDNALFADEVLTEWLGCYSDEEAARLVDAFFEAVEASGAQDANDFLSGGTKAIALLTEAAKNTGEGSRSTLMSAFTSLADVAARRFGQDVVSKLTSPELGALIKPLSPK